MASKYNVIYTGLKEGVTEAEFVRQFCQKFGVSEKKAHQIVTSGSEVTIKKDLDEDKAKKYLSVLNACGMVARMDAVAEEAQIPQDNGLSMVPVEEETNAEETVAEEAMSPTGSQNILNATLGNTASENTGSANTATATCPKCGSDQINGDECLACGIYISKYRAHQESQAAVNEGQPESVSVQEEASNPYATPDAELSEAPEPGAEAYPEKVPAGSGIEWLKQGFWHFRQNPFAWIGAVLVMFLLFIVLGLIPFLGGLLTQILTPVFIAGFVLGAYEQDDGGDFRVGHLFEGFSHNAGQLILVGVLYLVGVILILVVIGGGMMGLGMMSAGMDAQSIDSMAVMNQMDTGMIIMMLILFTLIILLTMAYYYAPALIAFDEMNAISAMKMSFIGCLKNWLAFIVLGILIFILSLVAMIPIMWGMFAAIPMFLLIFFVGVPTMQALNYVSYRDIFHH